MAFNVTEFRRQLQKAIEEKDKRRDGAFRDLEECARLDNEIALLEIVEQAALYAHESDEQP